MNDTFNTGRDDMNGDIELLLRRRLHELADHAPAAVRSIEEVTVRPFTSPPSRKRRRAAGIGATIAAIAGAVGITTVALNGAGSGGGGTPEEAVLLFVDALEHEDLLGMIDVVDPAEVPALRAAAEDGASEAQRIGLVTESFSLDGIDGLEVDVSDLTMQTDHVGDDVAVVSATGGVVTTQFDPASFPYGNALSEALGDPQSNAATVSSTTLGQGGDTVRLATVRRGGRWYLSLSYTVAELARSSADAEFPSAASVAPTGFDSPEAAVTALYERLAALDFEGVVATAVPGEGDALARYASLWLPTAADWGQRAYDSGYQLQVSGLSFDTTGDGDRQVLEPTAFVIEGTVPSSIGSTLDPTLPTAISLESGAGWVIIPAGEALPVNTDGFTIETSPPTDTNYNFTTADPNGVVVQVPFAADDPAAPLPLRVERAAGCTTWSGSGAATMSIPSFGSDFEVVGDDAWRSCGNTQWLPGILGPLGSGGATQLPGVATIEVDGQWYVSPLGTVAAAVLDVLHSVSDGASLFDSPIGRFVYGTDRALMERIYVGRTADQLASGCAALFVVDDTSTIVSVVSDPPPSLLRQCANGGISYSSSSSGSSTEPAVAVEEAPPATSVGG